MTEHAIDGGCWETPQGQGNVKAIVRDMGQEKTVPWQQG